MFEPLTQEDEVDELDSFFEHYADRYMASDVDAVAAMYEAPALAVRDGRVSHLASDAAVHEHVADLMDAYSRAGAARADIASLRIDELGAHAVNATVAWNVRGEDGELVRAFSTTYLSVRADGTLRIRAYTNHDG